MSDLKPVVYTVGHSTHTADYFLELLQSAGVNSVIDVRSIAASRYNPQFTKSRLASFLLSNNIRYFHLPEAFGARKTEPELQDETGRVDFEKVRDSALFRAGVNFLREEAVASIPVLMCAESDPLECHRFSMITVALRNEFEVRHILKDKSIIENEALEKLMLKKLKKKLPSPTLFESNEEQTIQTAFRLMNHKVGYKPG